MNAPGAEFDPYRALGLTPEASQEDLRAAYKRSVLELHPDGRPADAARDEAFRRATEAWKLLSDPELRRAYDRASRRAANSHPPTSLGYELGLLFRDLVEAGKQAKENLLAELAREEPQQYHGDSEDE